MYSYHINGCISHFYCALNKTSGLWTKLRPCSIKCDWMSLPKLYGPQQCIHCFLVSIETSQRKESLTTKLEMTYELVIPGLPKFKQCYVYSASWFIVCGGQSWILWLRKILIDGIEPCTPHDLMPLSEVKSDQSCPVRINQIIYIC